MKNEKRTLIETLSTLLLNGSNVSMMVPGDNPNLN